MTNYIDLHCHSTYSMLDGMGSPKEVVLRAKELGWSAAALTEHGHICSAPTFYKACVENGIKPILGCEMYVVPDELLGVKDKTTRTESYHLTVLALSREGYENLVAWNTTSMSRDNYYYRPRISLLEMADTAPHPLHHNVVLSGCLGSELDQMLLEADNGTAIAVAGAYVGAVKSLFSNFFVEIQNHRIPKWAGRDHLAYDALLASERAIRAGLLEVARVSRTPIVFTNDSHFQRVGQRKTHIAMRATAWRHRDDDHYGKSKEQMTAEYLKDYAYFGNYMRDMERVADGLPREGLDSIAAIVNDAEIRLDPLDRFSYSIPFSGYEFPKREIRRRCRDRQAALVAKHGSIAAERLALELEGMGEFAHYLLLMSDFIQSARAQGILTNTRGSAANSLLCYALGIHDIDSIEYGLTFTRFFNPARKKFPDIDIDVEKDRHEDFMQIVISRMQELEGDGQVVPICNLGTVANRSAFRTAASALGIPKEQQDDLAKLLPQMIDSGMVETETDAYEVLKADYPELYQLASEMFDSVRSVGQHACGWLFGTRDRPLRQWIPLYLITSSGALVTQYDMNALDDFGLVKGDFLRLRTLSVVKRALGLLGKSPLDLENIPLDDPDTFKMLRDGKTEGVFTLQGKENRLGCIEVGVESVDDVISSVALYRPALVRTGLHHLFNARKHGREVVRYPHPIAKKILGPTHGIPLFQEQAMELGYAVGMSDAEVDELYQAIKLSKGVGRHSKAAFAKIEPVFLERARSHMDESQAHAVWKLLVSFQGYGFNKGHATSYGLLAVRSAYLRCRHPAEFFTALLDVYPEKHKYIAAARGEGFKFAGPDVNFSQSGFSFDRRTGQIRVGLARIHGIGPGAVSELVRGQPFADLDDLKSRTSSRAVNTARIEQLAAAGALVSLGIPGEGGDDVQLALLGFLLDTPEALRGLKPKKVAARAREGSAWRHRGLQRDLELSAQMESVSKLFWIPNEPKLELKASIWASAKSYLLDAVDENGIKFHIICPETKQTDCKILKYLARKCSGQAVCLDGAVRQPYLNDGPQGFRFYSVTGSYAGQPQVWGVEEEVKETIVRAMAVRKMEGKKKNGASA
jgi:DNA polymerase-3 subunit alpha